MTRTGLSYSEEKHLRKLAADSLTRQQKCSTTKNGAFTHACYGEDLNTLDAPRKWLYDAGLAEGMSTEQARIYANKVVLHVNPVELEAEYQKLLRERVTAQVFP